MRKKQEQRKVKHSESHDSTQKKEPARKGAAVKKKQIAIGKLFSDVPCCSSNINGDHELLMNE